MRGSAHTPAGLSGVRNALRVLRVFSEENHVLGVSEIARRLNLPKSTTSRLVASLRSEEFLTATSAGKYRLGVRLVDRGLVAGHSHYLYDSASAVLVDIRQGLGFSTHFTVIEGGKLVQIHRLASSAMDMERRGKQRSFLPFHATSTGKAILGFSQPDLVEKIAASRLQRFTSETITEVDRLMAAIERVRSDGYATARDEYISGLSDVAVPIINKSGIAVAALTVIAPTIKMTDRAVRRANTLLLASALNIARSALR